MTNKRFILLVLDGTGVGFMPDCHELRPEDVGYNTINSVVNDKKNYPNLNKLGLFDIANNNFENNYASNGRFKLLHHGADTFFGHQEIMGSKPIKPILSTIKDNEIKISLALSKANLKFKFNKYFIVEDKIIVADNLEADFGQIINVSASTSEVSFDKITQVAKIIRATVSNSRVIALGGSKTNINKIKASIKETSDNRVGLITSNSGIYEQDYECIHMGYGVDSVNQVHNQLVKNKIDVSLIGKIQDIILGENIWRKPAVKTAQVMENIIKRINNQKNGLIAATVQETDLAGHSQSIKLFRKSLKIVDTKLEEIMHLMNEEDVLLITADHGNDPTNNSQKHTREYTPLILYGKNQKAKIISTRETLSDVAATILDFFKLNNTTNGKKFL